MSDLNEQAQRDVLDALEAAGDDPLGPPEYPASAPGTPPPLRYTVVADRIRTWVASPRAAFTAYPLDAQPGIGHDEIGLLRYLGPLVDVRAAGDDARLTFDWNGRPVAMLKVHGRGWAFVRIVAVLLDDTGGVLVAYAIGYDAEGAAVALQELASVHP